MIVFGRILLAFATVFGLLALLAWPPGGLMFALPFLFLFPALLLAGLGGVVLWLGKARRHRKAPDGDET